MMRIKIIRDSGLEENRNSQSVAKKCRYSPEIINQNNIKSILLFFLVIFISGCVSQAERPDYGLNTSIFENLPPFPKDFSVIDKQVESLNFDNINITENYYKQPEFYPTWESSGVGGFKSPPQGRIGILGMGAYPADRAINMNRSGEATVVVFFHSSWLVQTYQGMTLTVINPNPEYFDVNLDKNELLIGPNYPRFDKDWTQKVVIKIRSKSVPAGNYLIGVNPTSPSRGKSIEWSQKYTPYIDFFSGLDRPYVKIKVNIE